MSQGGAVLLKMIFELEWRKNLKKAWILPRICHVEQSRKKCLGEAISGSRSGWRSSVSAFLAIMYAQVPDPETQESDSLVFEREENNPTSNTKFFIYAVVSIQCCSRGAYTCK